jgi:uncharacterized protein YijF (DUF1287 family)
MTPDENRGGGQSEPMLTRSLVHPPSAISPCPNYFQRGALRDRESNRPTDDRTVRVKDLQLTAVPSHTANRWRSMGDRALTPAHCAAVIEKARALVTPTIRYDPSYVGIAFPNGDVPATSGVCADVIVRAFRGDGRDLQALVNSDMRSDFARYPAIWGMRKPDTNIDHRRVPNLMNWFARHGIVLPLSQKGSDYLPCDIVAWDLGNGVTHIGLVSDRVLNGKPAMIHHIGGHPTEEDVLFSWRMIGHFAL